ncbi:MULTISPECIES: hypothetical protein [Mycobacterium]|uniref:HEAT repeat domain-containing protein n=1 Tax=Mycobacterium kiyosense TaxID=2871094 RepID=A0A9P3UYQ8_9MYCO|nr:MULTISPECIES: hypothetical protein [Mycobacterium]BDB43178.1 hypothetical protein IWGMT90018_36240 [Mycobacterium kiyosense]BDE13620.1 hypothetical protein MKCMC460_24800 [Mycobacterium sp. 20KCMC460]GLB86488.1 hypothetical protein SRL2020028_57440 [Mycobacterium kiyosense]GLB91148.1 hypothetical protein SRL2020130_39650 [Mycobacterium kiyosense]GLB98948.1 hypothetical protein SRL2020226_57240 [Mycobacterium kiyosense]
MPPTHQWKRAHERLNADITKAAKRKNLPFRSITDLINTNERYPSLIPVLIDWLKNLENKSGLTQPTELHDLRDGLYRALTTVDAMGTEAVSLLFDSFYLQPPAPPIILATIGTALRYIAAPADYVRMRQVATDRSLSFGRAPLIEWLLRADPDDALPLAVSELDDPSVRPYILRSLRAIKHLPASLRSVIEPYLDDPDSEVRLQAKRTLAKLARD